MRRAQSVVRLAVVWLWAFKWHSPVFHEPDLSLIDSVDSPMEVAVAEVPDLDTQLRDILQTVRREEFVWRFEHRLRDSWR